MSNEIHISLLNILKDHHRKHISKNNYILNTPELILARNKHNLIIKDSEVDLIFDFENCAARRFILSEFHVKTQKFTNKRSKLQGFSDEITEIDIWRAITQPNVIQLIASNLEFNK